MSHHLPVATRRLLDVASGLGLEIDVHEFPEGTKTAMDAASAIGCEVAAIVKSLVFMVDAEPVVALVPGDRRLDPAMLASECGGDDARRATLDEAREATGFAPGGTPPFGYPRTLRVVADPSLRRHDPVWAAAGTPTTVFPISPDDLARVAGAAWAAISR